MEGRIVLKYYEIRKMLGKGAFGEIYLACNTQDKSYVAVKIQKRDANRPQLLQEAKFIIELHKSKNFGEILNVPNVYNLGEEDNYYIMVIDLLGSSLEDQFARFCGRRLSIESTVMAGLQILYLIEYIHSRGILHRDLKPDNFLVGRKNNRNRIYLIDFGLAKRFLNESKEHIVYRDNKDLTGTVRYASVNTHLGIEQGRRDDLQSFIYVLIYLHKGQLPWQNMQPYDNKKEKYQKIMQKKLSLLISKLVEGMPHEFQQMLAHIRSLHFTDKPDYDLLRQKLLAVRDRLGINPKTWKYDWINISDKP